MASFRNVSKLELRSPVVKSRSLLGMVLLPKKENGKSPKLSVYPYRSTLNGIEMLVNQGGAGCYLAELYSLSVISPC